MVELRKREAKPTPTPTEEESEVETDYSSEEQNQAGAIRMTVGAMSTLNAQPNPRDENSMFGELSKRGIAVSETLASWKQRFTRNAPSAFAELLTLVLQASGSTIGVNPTDIDIGSDDTTSIRDNLLSQIEYFGTNSFGSDLPLMSRKKNFKGLQKNFDTLWKLLFQELCAQSTSEEEAVVLRYILNVVITLSVVGYRPIRHAFTKLALVFMTVASDYTNASDDRAKAATRVEIISDCFRSVLNGVFHKRVRDIATEIRLLCVSAISKIVLNDPETTDALFKFVLWLLKDKDKEIRMAAAKSLYDTVSKTKDLDENWNLRALLESNFVPILDSSLYEPDRVTSAYVRGKVVPLLASKSLIEREYLQQLAQLLFSPDLESDLCGVLVQFFLSFELGDYLAEIESDFTEKGMAYSLCRFIGHIYGQYLITRYAKETLEKADTVQLFRKDSLIACVNIINGAESLAAFNSDAIPSIRESIAVSETRRSLLLLQAMLSHFDSLYFDIALEEADSMESLELSATEFAILSQLSVGFTRARFGVRYSADPFCLFEDQQIEQIQIQKRKDLMMVDVSENSIKEFIQECIGRLQGTLEKHVLKETVEQEDSFLNSDSAYQLKMYSLLELVRLSTIGFISNHVNGVNVVEASNTWLHLREVKSLESIFMFLKDLLVKLHDEKLVSALLCALITDVTWKKSDSQTSSLSGTSSSSITRRFVVSLVEDVLKSTVVVIDDFHETSTNKAEYFAALRTIKSFLIFSSVNLKQTILECIPRTLLASSLTYLRQSRRELSLNEVHTTCSLVYAYNMLNLFTRKELDDGHALLEIVHVIAKLAEHKVMELETVREEYLETVARDPHNIVSLQTEFSQTMLRDVDFDHFMGKYEFGSHESLLAVASDSIFLLLSTPLSQQIEDALEELSTPICQLVQCAFELRYVFSLKSEQQTAQDLESTFSNNIQAAIQYAKFASNKALPYVYDDENTNSISDILAARQAVILLVRTLWICLRFDTDQNYWTESLGFLLSIHDRWESHVDDVSKCAVEELVASVAQNFDVLSGTCSNVLVDYLRQLATHNICTMQLVNEEFVSKFDLSHYQKSTKFVHGLIKSSLGIKFSSIMGEMGVSVIRNYGVAYLEENADAGSDVAAIHFTVLLQSLSTLGSLGGAAKFALITPDDSATLYRFIHSNFQTDFPPNIADSVQRFQNHLKNVAKMGKIELEDSPVHGRKAASKRRSPQETQKRQRKEDNLEMDVESFQGSPVAKRPKRLV